jgi:hypothetical protein
VAGHLGPSPCVLEGEGGGWAMEFSL